MTQVELLCYATNTQLPRPWRAEPVSPEGLTLRVPTQGQREEPARTLLRVGVAPLPGLEGAWKPDADRPWLTVASLVHAVYIARLRALAALRAFRQGETGRWADVEQEALLAARLAQAANQHGREALDHAQGAQRVFLGRALPELERLAETWAAQTQDFTRRTPPPLDAEEEALLTAMEEEVRRFRQGETTTPPSNVAREVFGG